VAAHVERVFDHPTRLLRRRGHPEDSLDAARGQHASGRILAWLVARAPEQTGKILAITDVDLFIPVLTFVFGEAQLGGLAAVVSTARLNDDASRGDRARRLARLSKEAVHELGHTFGLLHCTAPCVMSRSASLEQIDAKRSGPCPDCRERLREASLEESDDGTE
jgi:archaemetzincin